MKFTFDKTTHQLLVDGIIAIDWEKKHFPNNEQNSINIELGEYISLLDENTLYITPNKNNFYDIFNIMFNENRDIIEDHPDGRSIHVTLDRSDFIAVKDLVIRDYNQFSKDHPNTNIELLYVYTTGMVRFYEEHWDSGSWKDGRYDNVLEWDITKTRYGERVIESYSLIDTIKDLII